MSESITLDSLGDWRRSHDCGALRASDVGSEVCLMGWAQFRRDHGGLIFIDLRDRAGLTQVVFCPEGSEDALDRAHVLRVEYVLAIRGRVRPRPEGMAKVLLPLMTIFARLFHISKSRVRSSFIKVNNEMVTTEAVHYPPEKLLVLLPHCLQSSRCAHRLTYDIRNCKRCGKCPVDGLIALSEHYGVHIAIATGGTIARRIVVQQRPKLIVAVACERDLSSGIQDTYPIPVYGVLNERPNGPCLDTLVSLPRLERALRHFLIDGESMGVPGVPVET